MWFIKLELGMFHRMKGYCETFLAYIIDLWSSWVFCNVILHNACAIAAIWGGLFLWLKCEGTNSSETPAKLSLVFTGVTIRNK